MARPALPRLTRRVPLVLIALLAAMTGIEAALSAADLGWIGSRRWRSLAYQYGAFWPGLLETWAPNYRGQAAAMFVTYAGLHAGLEHLAGNVIALWSLGSVVTERIGQRGFAAVFALTSLGGALCFAALSPGLTPMVGASGAVFGLAGLWLGWQWQERRPGWRDPARIAAIAAGLVALNLVLHAWYDGGLAWQTHLGGFAVGLALAGWLGRPDPARQG